MDVFALDMVSTIKKVDDVFINVADRLVLGMDDFFELDEDTKWVKKRIEKTGDVIPNAINYHKYAYEFNKAFFLKNLYKNLTSISYLADLGIPLSGPIVDIGSGAGPSSLAYVLLFPSRTHQAILIDRNEAQLEFAQKVRNLLKINHSIFLHKSIDNNLAIEELREGTVFASYFFCEQNPSAFDRIAKILLNKFQLALVVVDYPDIVSRFIQTIDSICNTPIRWELEIPLGSRSNRILKEKALHVNGCYLAPC